MSMLVFIVHVRYRTAVHNVDRSDKLEPIMSGSEVPSKMSEMTESWESSSSRTARCTAMERAPSGHASNRPNGVEKCIVHVSQGSTLRGSWRGRIYANRRGEKGKGEGGRQQLATVTDHPWQVEWAYFTRKNLQRDLSKRPQGSQGQEWTK
jgi:hypothetical protein